MTFGEKLKELRGNRSQDEIAQELGITKNSLTMYENDERAPSDEVIIRMAHFFNKSVYELFLG